MWHMRTTQQVRNAAIATSVAINIDLILNVNLDAATSSTAYIGKTLFAIATLKPFLIGARMKPVSEMNFDELVLELHHSVKALIRSMDALRKSREAVATVKQQAKGCRKAKLPKR
jgi:hypothetical protein